ncbi:hypothetical protein KSP39_PZI022674 [Platanthera zijinensis]|uniref:FLZ-type domain-containing protein n=1 Tax=Platanthera zijinensis TaxID=2320716 RepID=A0AAP0FUF4_9ASPA
MAGKPRSSPFPTASFPDGAGNIVSGFSGGVPAGNPLYYKWAPYQTLSLPTPNIVFLDDEIADGECHHFLDSCFLCKKHLMGNRDIYMYRGDMPFCSNECRQEQIEIDEARERNLKIAMRKEQQQRHKNSSSPTKSQRIRIRIGAVVPA